MLDTVDSSDGGGEGEPSREDGVTGVTPPTVARGDREFLVGRGRVVSSLPGVSWIIPLAFIVSRWGFLATKEQIFVVF